MILRTLTLTGVLMTAAIAAPTPVIAQTGGPIEIIADNLEVLRARQSARFTGSVVAKQQGMELAAESLTVLYANVEGTRKSEGKSPKINRLQAVGNVAVSSEMGRATGQAGDYDVSGGTLTLSGNVVLTRDGNVLQGDRLDMDVNAGTAQLVPGPDGARVQGQFHQQGQADGNSEPISVIADRLTVDRSRNLAIFQGKVRVRQKDTQLDTPQLRINFTETSNPAGQAVQEVTSMDAVGGVRVSAPFGTATGKSGRYHLKSADIALNGDVQLVRQKNTLKGQSLVMNINTGVARLTNNKGGKTGGRVRGTFVPENRN